MTRAARGLAPTMAAVTLVAVTLAAALAACGAGGRAAEPLRPSPSTATASTPARPAPSLVRETPATRQATTTTPRPLPTPPTSTTTLKPVPVVGTLAPTTACPAALPSELASTGQANQLITVEASSAEPARSGASVTLWQRAGPCWQAVAGPWPARIGVNGFSDHHREGDGTTPAGRFGIGPVAYGNAPNPGTALRYHQLVCGDWWDEDPASPAYNTFQHVSCGQSPPFGGGSEALWTETTAYPGFAVVEYNTDPIVPYAGSAIFVHADTGSPTNGCVSVALPNLDYLLRWLNPADSPTIVMGPGNEIDSF